MKRGKVAFLTAGRCSCDCGWTSVPLEQREDTAASAALTAQRALCIAAAVSQHSYSILQGQAKDACEEIKQQGLQLSSV